MYSSVDLMPSRTEKWVAAGVCAFLALVALFAIPYSPRIMPVAPQFLTINLTVAVLSDIFVALVLALQFRASGYFPIGILTLGYSTTAMIAAAQAFGFPGIVIEHGMFAANSQTFIWLWSAWHAEFAFFAVLYAAARRGLDRDRAEPANGIVWGVVACGCAFGYGIAWFAFRFALPVLIVHTVYAPSFHPIEALLIGGTVASIGVILVATQLRSVLDLWLTVALVGMLGDVILTTYGGARFSVGWYLARLFGQATNCAVALGFFSKLAVIYIRMSRMAYVDGLTSLGNRRALDQRLAEAIQNSIRERSPVSLLMIDVDDFKKYNDLYGHVAGDDALRTVAATIGAIVSRPLDTTARYGGEEFAVLLMNTNLDGATTVAERIRSELVMRKIPHTGSSACPYLTVSIGVATAHSNEIDGRLLIGRADGALYDAKVNGRNTVSSARSDREGMPCEKSSHKLSA